MKNKTCLILLIVGFCFLLFASPAGAQSPKKLYLYNWAEYINPEIINKFEKKYDVKVVTSFYTSNSEMFAKLQAGGDSQYDVVVPTDYYVPRLIKAGLIKKLDKRKLSNLKNLMEKFRDTPYDPKSAHSVAYLWGYTGVAYNANDFKNPPKSLSLLFDPKVNLDYPFGMIPGAQFMIGYACAYQGHGYACTNVDDWKQAAKLLIKTKTRSNFNAFYSGVQALRLLSRGVLGVAMAYNGDYIHEKMDSPKAFKNIKFFLPKEGGQLWVDTMAIPKSAPHPNLAYEFINFILKAEVGAENANWAAYASPNKAALPYLNKILRKPPIMPSKQNMRHLQFTPALKGKKLETINQLWAAVKSH